jgi:hypothetical protein
MCVFVCVCVHVCACMCVRACVLGLRVLPCLCYIEYEPFNVCCLYKQMRLPFGQHLAGICKQSFGLQLRLVSL